MTQILQTCLKWTSKPLCGAKTTISSYLQRTCNQQLHQKRALMGIVKTMGTGCLLE